MNKILTMLIGDLREKKEYRNTEKRAKALPDEYREAYKNIRNYLWSASGIIHIDPLVTLVDMFEEAAAEGKRVIDLTGLDVAAFADELARGVESYKDHESRKLNQKMNK